MKRFLPLLAIIILMNVSLINVARGAEFELLVSPGWNLLNSPLQPADNSLQAIIANHKDKIISIWKWQNGNWAVALPGYTDEEFNNYVQQKGFAILNVINAGEGFWVNSKDKFSLVISGQYPEDSCLSLMTGWNLTGLKANQETDIQELFSNVKEKIISVWSWQENTWAVYLFSQPEQTQAYAQSKGFYVLSKLKPGQGFWVNVSEDTGEFPFVEGMVLDGSVVGMYKPVPGAQVYLNDKKIAETNLYGLFKYYGTDNVTVQIKADGYEGKECQLNASSGQRNYFILQKIEQNVPEASFENKPVEMARGSYNSSDFKEYPNLFLILASPPPIPATATPKTISDKYSAFIITEMKLERDITVSLNTYHSKDEIPLSNLENFFLESSDILLLGGATVSISDSTGKPLSSDEAGFQARVRVINKEYLSNDKLSLADIYNQVQSGAGRIYLFYFKGDEWLLAGDARIKADTDGSSYYFTTTEGVFLTGLYPFVFVYSPEKTITGRVIDLKGNPVADALVSCDSSFNMAVSAKDGSFEIRVPEALNSTVLKIIHEDYYLKDKVVDLSGTEIMTDIGNVQLQSLDKKEFKGSIKDQNGNPVSGLTLILNIESKFSNILLPDKIKVISDSNGQFSFGYIAVDVLQGATLSIETKNGYQSELDIELSETDEETIVENLQVVLPCWIYQTGGNIYGSPVVRDGKVLIGSCDGKLYCLNADSGLLLYSYDTDRGIFSKPLADETNVFITTLKNRLYILNIEDGSPGITNGYIEANQFASDAPDIISSPIFADSQIIFGSTDKSLYAFKYNGLPNWIEPQSSVITSTPAFYDNKIYFGSWDGYFYCYGSSIEEHGLKWKYPKDSPLLARIISSPLVQDGRVYFGGGNNIKVITKHKETQEEVDYYFNTQQVSSKVIYSNDLEINIIKEDEDKYIYCLDALTGQEIWKYAIGGSVVSMPAIAGDRLVLGSLDGYVYCLDIADQNNVKLAWKYQTDGEIYSSPLIQDDKVYIGSNDGRLYCLDLQTGQKFYSFKAKRAIISSPAYHEGKIFFGSLDGGIYCLSID